MRDLKKGESVGHYFGSILEGLIIIAAIGVALILLFLYIQAWVFRKINERDNKVDCFLDIKALQDYAANDAELMMSIYNTQRENNIEVAEEFHANPEGR